MNAEQPVRCLAAQRIGDTGTLIAALRDIAGVAEAVHQLRPGVRDAAGIPPDLLWHLREAVAGDGWNHEV